MGSCSCGGGPGTHRGCISGENPGAGMSLYVLVTLIYSRAERVRLRWGVRFLEIETETVFWIGVEESCGKEVGFSG